MCTFSLIYKKHGFYIEDRYSAFSHGDNDQREDSILHSTSPQKNDLRKSISINHELNHYIQDLLLYSCITQSSIEDIMTGLVSQLSHNENLKFPLFDKNNENLKYNKKVNLNKTDAEKLNYLIILQDIYSFLFRSRHKIPNDQEYKFINDIIPNDINLSLTFNNLLETYAYHKSYWDFFCGKVDEINASILHEIIQENNVYPFECSNEENLSKISNQYKLIHFILLKSLGFNSQNIIDYYRNEIPYKYREENSETLLFHSSMRCILETALNIPSDEFILSTIMSGEYDITTFSPVHRFYKTIKLIHECHRFPDAKPNESYFVTFYNWVAMHYHWPDLEQTNNSILKGLYERLKTAGEIIIGYQLTAINFKIQKWGAFCQESPLQLLQIWNLPIIIVSAKGVTVTSFINQTQYSQTEHINLYNLFFGAKKGKYQFIFESDTEQIKTQKILENAQNAYFEMLHRVLSYNVMISYLYTGSYSCPFAILGCPHNIEECKEFRNIDDVLTNCKMINSRNKRKFPQYPSQARKVHDCMFLNYLLDNNFKPFKF